MQTGAVATFGRAGVQFLVLPLVVLSAISKADCQLKNSRCLALGERVIAALEIVVAPVVLVYLACFLWSMVGMAREWSGTRAELEHVRDVSEMRAATVRNRNGHVPQQQRPLSPPPPRPDHGAHGHATQLTGLAPHDINSGARIIELEECVACLQPLGTGLLHPSHAYIHGIGPDVTYVLLSLTRVVVVLTAMCVVLHALVGGVEHRVLVCGHRPLCDGCLEAWVMTKGRASCCPCCRQNLYQAA